MKTAIISGGSRGIGKAAALTLAKNGYRVIVNYLNSRLEAERIEKTIIENGGSACIYKADVSDPQATAEMVEYARSAFGSVDLAVANAGIAGYGLLIDSSADCARRLIDVNLIGVINLCREAGRVMLSQKSGNIVTIASMWGEIGASCESVYSAAKGGVIALTKALAKEFAPSGVRVNCVSPGFIDTEMNSALSKEDVSAIVSEIPLARAGSPQDVADAIEWLASEKSSYVTGQIISVNGGLII